MVRARWPFVGATCYFKFSNGDKKGLLKGVIVNQDNNANLTIKELYGNKQEAEILPPHSNSLKPETDFTAADEVEADQIFMYDRRKERPNRSTTNGLTSGVRC